MCVCFVVICNNICLIVDIGCRELIAGSRSFGALLEKEGYYAVPSPRQPFPGIPFKSFVYLY